MKQRILAILITCAFGLCLGAATLMALSQPINVVAYWAGYGDPVQVVITEGSSGWSWGRSDPGEGRTVLGDSMVRLYDVSVGETVTARARLINIGTEPYLYHSSLNAAADLVWLIPTILFGAPFALLILAVVAPSRVHHITRRLQAYNERKR
ncbi:hypothetical protein ACFC06_20665 [Nocardia sp. NPDC056064]|uniref:hypothetical protein n=1 Tax=Nocardia sp. NPDC056064 TaxID=3345701 RepID=UPI0035DE2BD3